MMINQSFVSAFHIYKYEEHEKALLSPQIYFHCLISSTTKLKNKNWDVCVLITKFVVELYLERDLFPVYMVSLFSVILVVSLFPSVVSIVRFVSWIVRYETIQVFGDTNRELYRFYSCIVLVSYDTSLNHVNHDSIHDTNLSQFENLVFPSIDLPPNWNPNFSPFIFRTLKLINLTY